MVGWCVVWKKVHPFIKHVATRANGLFCVPAALDLMLHTLSVAPDLPRRLKRLFATSPDAVTQLRYPTIALMTYTKRLVD